MGGGVQPNVTQRDEGLGGFQNRQIERNVIYGRSQDGPIRIARNRSVEKNKTTKDFHWLGERRGEAGTGSECDRGPRSVCQTLSAPSASSPSPSQWKSFCPSHFRFGPSMDGVLF